MNTKALLGQYDSNSPKQSQLDIALAKLELNQESMVTMNQEPDKTTHYTDLIPSLD